LVFFDRRGDNRASRRAAFGANMAAQEDAPEGVGGDPRLHGSTGGNLI
jgi:hypothetical protein